jgi:hypothetical protein
VIYTAGQSLPSFQQGFARSRGESEYPELWNNLVGLWSPSLGPQGLTTLRDWSGRRIDGELNGSFDHTDWVASQYGYALDFNGSSQYIKALFPFPYPYMSFPITMGARFYTNGGTDQGILDYGFNSARRIILYYSNTSGKLEGYSYSPDAASPSSASVTLGSWHYAMLSYDGVTLTIDLDGIQASQTRSWDGLADGSGVPSLYMGVALADAGSPPALGAYLNGRLSDAIFYNRILPYGERLALYLGASPLTLKRRVYGKPTVVAQNFYRRRVG